MQLSAEQDVSSEGSTYAKLDKVERIIPEKSDKIIQSLWKFISTKESTLMSLADY